MKDTQLYKYTTWFLLAINIGFLVFLFFSMRPPPDRLEGLSKHMIQVLQLENEQLPTFTTSVEKHKQQVSDISIQQKQVLRKYFETLIGVPADQEALLQQIQELERQKVKNTYQHFQEVKNMLTAGQLPSYKKFMGEAMDKMLPLKTKPLGE